MRDPHVVILGSITKGIEIIGPFQDYVEAEEYMKSGNEARSAPYEIAMLSEPLWDKWYGQKKGKP